MQKVKKIKKKPKEIKFSWFNLIIQHEREKAVKEYEEKLKANKKLNK